MTSAEVLRMSGVSRRFVCTDQPVLRHLDLIVETSDRVAIVGESGAGKSTLLNILGLLDRPDSGEHLVGGVNMGRASDRVRARSRATALGFVFQQFHLMPALTATENVELGLSYAGVRRAKRRVRALSTLAAVGLEAQADQVVATLSGGQQQRVAIARALCRRPKLLLCDEPTGNLDRETGEQVLDLLLDLHERDVAIVVITHDLDVAARMERTLHLSGGRLHEGGSVSQVS